MHTNVISSGRALELSSDGFHGGGALKRELGPRQFVGALLGGYERATQIRAIALPGFRSHAITNPDSYFLGAPARVAYPISFGALDVKPYADIDLVYNHASAYRVTGASKFNLAQRAERRVSVMAAPSFELGGRIDLPEANVRPYLAGVSFVSNSDAKAHLSFAEFSGASFEVATLRRDALLSI